MILYIAECERPDGNTMRCSTDDPGVIADWFESLLRNGIGCWDGNAAGVIPKVNVRRVKLDGDPFAVPGC